MKNNEVIEKMAQNISYHCPDLAESGCRETNCAVCIAEKLINEGYTKNKIPEGAVVLSREEYKNDFCSQFDKGYKIARKETAKEILSLAIIHDNGYETDMTRFISDLKKQYGVEE